MESKNLNKIHTPIAESTFRERFNIVQQTSYYIDVLFSTSFYANCIFFSFSKSLSWQYSTAYINICLNR